MLPSALGTKVKARLEVAVKEHVFPGCVFGIINKNGERDLIAIGHHTYEQNSPLTSRESIFDVASLTKVIPTNLLALQLIDQGKLGIHDPIRHYLPEMTSKSSEQATIHNLLTYTYLLKRDQPLAALINESPETIIKVLFDTETAFVPGSKFHYSNTPSILLGMILQRILNKSLVDAAQESVFDPLEMTHTTFSPKNPSLVIPTEINARGLVQGKVHDECASALQPSFQPGCAGTFSTADDVLNALSMLLHDGVYKNHRLLRQTRIQELEINQLAPIGSSHGLGIELNQPQYMGSHCATTTIGKTGFTGTVIVSDRHRGIAFTLLSNRTFPTRPTDRHGINVVRRDIADLVWSI
ncbi:serine hydrolase [Candidatus Gracilibacteria bacterium]|nr:serine hydrolase [Candidatus Gracilibacteria bacterium]